MSNASFPSVSPTASFYAVSGIDPIKMKIVMAIILIAVLLLAYAWASNHGYKGMVNNGGIWSYLKLVLWGASLFLCVVYFFIY
ncbi:hypothetical protein BKG92_07625 [Rodentibacter ratti]|uniref:Integrating conjugative element protein n=1 Tax=Rodentibacter ratti TaxID=1906745 RepID=A0A1V3KWH3_9PAST|nr:DUF3262 family protein [Rodentibacter ratti]OOF81981.1 hypothetical protein BKG92_07625 [Rodentibacter ratti]